MKRFLMDKHVEFSMTNNFSLSIKQHIQATEPEAEAAAVTDDEINVAE